MNDHLTQVQRRALQYWFVDGLAELGAGMLALLLAGLFLYWEQLTTSRWSLLLLMLGLFALSFGARLLIQRIKERTTYPRTGYVAPLTGLENKSSLVIALGFTLVLLLVNGYLTIWGPRELLQSAAIPGLIFAFVFGWTGYLVKLRRFYVLAVFSLLAGIVLAFLGLDSMRTTGSLSGLVGIILLAQGALARRAYLRHNPPCLDPDDE